MDAEPASVKVVEMNPILSLNFKEKAKPINSSHSKSKNIVNY